MRIIVTGGAGFIGSAVVRRLILEDVQVLNIDKLTYAGNLWNVADVECSPNYQFLNADIADATAIAGAFREPERSVLSQGNGRRTAAGIRQWKLAEHAVCLQRFVRRSQPSLLSREQAGHKQYP